MELTNDDKDELRLLMQEEISKAFNAALNAALNIPIQIHEINSTEVREARQRHNAIVNQIGNAIKSALRDLKDEAHAKIVEKTDPARAEVIRKLKPTF